MKKIAILTLNGYKNYGNRLQNYALQEVLKKYNFHVDTIINEPVKLKRSLKSKIFEHIMKIKKNNLKNIFHKVKSKLWLFIKGKQVISLDFEREVIFKDFSFNYLSETKQNNLNFEKFLLTNIKNYSFYIIGSDQVWNPTSVCGSSFYFAGFAPKKKRIAYAPSFGVSTIPEEFKENYKKWLNDMKHISVREEEGSKIIKDLTGRDVPVHVDPTLLLTKEKWLTIKKPASNKPNEKYMVTYFLGGVPQEYKNQIKKIAKDNNLKVINLGDIKEKETYITGPSEFVDYISSCNIICTDSFHGTVFSILFEKPFIVYERIGGTSMYSRIETLLDMFNLREREIKNIKTNDVFYIDYSHVPKILEKERKKAFDYLKKALNIENRK